ncbi:MAG: DUF5317 domain-containing protein [Actinomycetota bacterium]
MTFVLLVLVVAAIVALVRGGTFHELARTNFRWSPLLLAALVAQLVFDYWDPEWLSEGGGLAVILITNAAVAVFLARNWNLPGMGLAAAGMVLNVVVIAANGAMPVSLRAAELAGLQGPPREPGLKHEILTDDTVLPFLADVIPLPVLERLISIGDVVLAAGIGWLVYSRMMAGRAKEATPEASG